MGILIAVLVMNYSPMMAGFIAILALYVTALFRKTSRISFMTLLKTLAQGAKNAVVVAVPARAAGIIVGGGESDGDRAPLLLPGGIPFQGIPLLAWAWWP